MSSPAVVGTDAGWHLAFFTEAAGGLGEDTLSVGAGDYYAEITATLPCGLEGGSYRFSIEGITGGHYKQLHDVWSAKPRKPLYVDLYLYWRDTGAGGYLASVAGLTATLDRLRGTPPDEQRVARLIVTRLSRRVGPRRYEAVIEARERVYDALAQRLARPPAAAATAVEAAARIAKTLGVPYESHALAALAGGQPAPKFELAAGRKGVQALAALEAAMAQESKRIGLPMYVIRDGKLHIGPGRTIPLAGAVKPLDPAQGLVHIETTSQAIADQPEDDDPSAVAPPSHLQYSLTLQGRPDLRPGDAVSFADPFSDAGNPLNPASALNAATRPLGVADALVATGSSLLGGASALVGGATTMYVTSVSHRLSRTEGFVTTIAGIGVQQGSEWDPVQATTGDSPPVAPSATSHDDVAGAISDLVKSMQPELLTVGEVRAATTSGSGEPPSQTVDVWVGLTGDDGKPHGARRLAIDRDRKSRQSGVPYATPFAWGKCGLVVPRYPGMRVVLARAGAGDDAIDVGAIWESGHGPDASPGDWWLNLPAGLAPADRQSVDDATTPQEPSTGATSDLIDADGQRTIEVGRLTVRVTPNQLRDPGERPEPPSDSAAQVTIEHESGSRIVIKDNGDIVIESANDLRIATKKTMTLEADDVKVKVTNAMDIGDRT